MLIGTGLSLSSRPAGLPQSLPMTVSGPGITAVLGPDGMYTITTGATSTTASFVTTADDAFAGDYLAEIQIVVHANNVWAGFDNAAYAFGGAGSIDECFFPDAGFGANKANYYKNNVLTVSNVAFAGRIYNERVGTVLKFYNGVDFNAAKAAGAIITSTAVDAAARSFIFSVDANALVSQWKVRAIPHP